MKIIGKATINPFLFYSGKISGYLTWVFIILDFFGLTVIPEYKVEFFRFVSYFLFGCGIFFIVFSSINLGKSTRLGLPQDDTELKMNGIYRISRNPMYVGFNLVTLSAVFGVLNPVLWLFAAYSIIIYHWIILGEEKYLLSRFAEDYVEYKKKVRRYL